MLLNFYQILIKIYFRLNFFYLKIYFRLQAMNLSQKVTGVGDRFLEGKHFPFPRVSPITNEYNLRHFMVCRKDIISSSNFNIHLDVNSSLR